MSGRLASPRFRRRALKVGALAAVAGATAAVSIVFWNTGTPVDSKVVDRETGPAIVNEPREPVRLTAQEQRQALRTAALFVETAVRRERTGDSFDLVTAALRQGMTRAQWAEGEIPVTPYPVDGARWKVDYSYADELGLQVYVVPRVGESLRPTVFFLTMKKESPKGRWLVDAWVPRGISESATAPSGSSPLDSSATSGGLGLATPDEGRVPRVLLLVPVLLVALGLSIPVARMLRDRRAARRAQEAYDAELRARATDSSSPS